jgi:uncharacterized protein (UPF0261 family)
VSTGRIVAVSHCPRTASGAELLRRRLRESGWVDLSFEADGAGGAALEAAVRAGRCDAVIEWSLTELAMEHLGQPTAAGRDRLTAAAAAGLPQVVVLNGLDAAEIARGDSIRATVEVAGRRLARTTAADADALGREIAFKLSASRGPVVVLLPRNGLSILDGPGRPLHDPAANAALAQSLRSWLSPAVQLRGVDAAIDSPALVDAALAALEEITGH